MQIEDENIVQADKFRDGRIKIIPHPVKTPKNQDKMVLNYRFEEVVGYGAWGKVKKGWDVESNRKVAIKILRKKRISRKIKDGISKIYREFVLLNSLDHAGIVKYYDLIETNYEESAEGKSDTDSDVSSLKDRDYASSPSSSLLSSYSTPGFKDGKMYLVMEWLGDGCNLTSWISKTSENRPITSIRAILKQLLEALEYLKAHQISHHDIKLDNIIFNDDADAGDDGSVKLIDFGVSEMCINDQSYCAFGTPAYQAPEILLRSDPSIPISGHKSDIWSLGIVAYQLGNLECKLPFEGESIFEVFEGIIRAKPDYSLIKDPLLRDLIRKLLRKDPKKRLSSAEALNHPFITGRKEKIYSTIKNYFNSTFCKVKAVLSRFI